MPQGSPIVECPTWCEKSNGHTDVHHPDDHDCVSEPRTVFVSPYPILGDDTEPRVREQLDGFIHREAGESMPYIRLNHNDTTVIDLSIEDALRLAAELRSLTDTA